MTEKHDGKCCCPKCGDCSDKFDPNNPNCGKCGENLSRSPKSIVTAFLLCSIIGFLGAHRFYVGKIGTGVLQLITLGGLGIWAFIDFYYMAVGAFRDAQCRRLRFESHMQGIIAVLVLMVVPSLAMGGFFNTVFKRTGYETIVIQKPAFSSAAKTTNASTAANAGAAPANR